MQQSLILFRFLTKECLCLIIKSKIVKIASSSSQVYPRLTYLANFSQYQYKVFSLSDKWDRRDQLPPTQFLSELINRKITQMLLHFAQFLFSSFQFFVCNFQVFLFLFVCSPRSGSSCKDDHQWVPSGSAPWSCRCLQPKISCADFYKQIKKYLVSRVWSCRCLQPGISCAAFLLIKKY